MRKEVLQKKTVPTEVREPKAKKTKKEKAEDAASAAADDSSGTESTLFPGIASTVRYCTVLAVVALTSYVIVLVGLFFILRFFPADGVLTMTQSLVGVFILQLPVLAIILTTFINLRALSESMKVFSQVAESLVQKHQ